MSLGFKWLLYTHCGTVWWLQSEKTQNLCQQQFWPREQRCPFHCTFLGMAVPQEEMTLTEGLRDTCTAMDYSSMEKNSPGNNTNDYKSVLNISDAPCSIASKMARVIYIIFKIPTNIQLLLAYFLFIHSSPWHTTAVQISIFILKINSKPHIFTQFFDVSHFLKGLWN